LKRGHQITKFGEFEIDPLPVVQLTRNLNSMRTVSVWKGYQANTTLG